MAIGDPWEISLAAPVPNYRFAEWNRTLSDGPKGWVIGANTSVDLRSRAYSAQGSLFFTSATSASMTCRLGPRAFAPVDFRVSIFLRYRSTANMTCLMNLKNAAGAIQGTNSVVATTSATWAEKVSATTSLTSSQLVQSGEIAFLGPANFSYFVSEVVIRWVPSVWSTSAYETLDSVPEPDGLYYGPVGGGGERIFTDSRRLPDFSNRAERWQLRASWSALKEADALVLQRYYLASIGGIDGAPHPVAIRSYLHDGSTGPAPDYIVGRFTQFAFDRDSLGGNWVGELVLEEW